MKDNWRSPDARCAGGRHSRFAVRNMWLSKTREL